MSGKYWNSMGSLSSRSEGRRSCMETRTGACRLGSAYGGVRNTMATCRCTSACEKEPRASQPGPVKYTSMSSAGDGAAVWASLLSSPAAPFPPLILVSLRFINPAAPKVLGKYLKPVPCPLPPAPEFCLLPGMYLSAPCHTVRRSHLHQGSCQSFGSLGRSSTPLCWGHL